MQFREKLLLFQCAGMEQIKGEKHLGGESVPLTQGYGFFPAFVQGTHGMDVFEINILGKSNRTQNQRAVFQGNQSIDDLVIDAQKNRSLRGRFLRSPAGKEG